MRKIEAKSILTTKNTMNIYRGCSHGCIYCDSRSTIYQIDGDFEDIIVKDNAVQLLQQTLIRKKQKCMIHTGAMSDPYIPLEKTLGTTRKCLELIEQYGFGLTIITKSDLILRDLDILQRINQKSKCVVQVTMTTYDDKLSKILEPNVCPTSKRVEILRRCKEVGIDTIVWITPTLPYINDTIDNITGILSYCKETKVKGIMTFGCGMTLREGNREYYYQKLDEHFPGLKQKYQQEFGMRYGIGNHRGSRIEKEVQEFGKREGIMTNTKQIFDYLYEFPRKYEQLTLF